MLDFVSVCVGKNCREKQSREIIKILDSYLREHESEETREKLKITLCNKHCENGPVVYCAGFAIGELSVENAVPVLQAFLSKNFNEIFSHLGLKDLNVLDLERNHQPQNE